MRTCEQCGERFAKSPNASHAVYRRQRFCSRACSNARHRADPGGRARRSTETRKRLRAEVISGYGGRCVCCGTDYLPHLTIDHVHNDGAAERRVLGNGQRLYWRLRREGFPRGDYQVLCFNCNWAKHHLGKCGCQEQPSVAIVS